MCGRFTLKTPTSAWVQELFPGLSLLDLPENPPRYNIAPTQPILCLLHPTEGAELRGINMRWGLVPTWADDLSIGNRMINARSETLTEKPSFKRAFLERRCAIVADGYYEWKKDGKEKHPYWIHRPSEKPFLMAGLWEVNRKISPESPLTTVTIITTEANEVTGQVHDRMPAMLTNADQIDQWLAPSLKDPAILQSLLHPAAVDYFELREVSRQVNRPTVDLPECITPV